MALKVGAITFPKFENLEAKPKLNFVDELLPTPFTYIYISLLAYAQPCHMISPSISNLPNGLPKVSY